MKFLNVKKLLPLLFLPLATLAQNRYTFDQKNDIPVVMDGDTLNNPWAGGMNYNQYSEIDLDFDGIKDLVAFEKAGGRVLPFLKKGTGNNTYYEYAPEYIKKFPKGMTNWMLLVDYDCDGKEDIFTFATAGIGVYRNTSSNGELSFEWALGNNPHLRVWTGSIWTNVYNSSEDIPGIVDIDGDGAIDILNFGMNTSVTWYKNNQPCGLDFTIETTCWGGFQEGDSASTITLNACTYNKKEAEDEPEGTQHFGSTFLFLDLSGNALPDLLLGDVDNPNIKALFNNGTIDTAHITQIDNTYPSYNTPLSLMAFPAASWVDVNNDNKKDLIFSPNDPAGRNYESQHLYLNTSASSTGPQTFAYSKDNFLQEGMIEMGERTIPVLYDVNRNGLLDLVVSNRRFSQDTISANHINEVWLFENKGTKSKPVFERVTKNFAGLNNLGFGHSLAPTFGDLNGNGFPDMIVGSHHGRIHYLEHNGSQSNPQWLVKYVNYEGIDVGLYATPFLYDIDGDGDLDLFIGSSSGTIHHYKNTGSSTNPDFSLVTTDFAGVNTSTNFSQGSGMSQPVFLEAFGTSLLLVGSNAGGVQQFDSLNNVTSLPANITGHFGNGTTASTNFNITPFGTSKRAGRNQFLIRASELKAEGFEYGKVTSIGFQVSTGNNPTMFNGIVVNMRNVTDNELSGLQSFQNETPNFDNMVAFSQGWNGLALQTPFQWDGVSNILVQVCFSRNQIGNDIGVYVEDVGFGANAYGDAANNNTMQAKGCELPYSGVSTLRPNIRLQLTPTAKNVETLFKEGTHNYIALGDLDDDGFPEAILGNLAGGLTYYKGREFDNINVPEFKPLREKLVIYPNPTADNAFLRIPANMGGSLDVVVFNIYGQEIMKYRSSGENPVELDVSNLANGMYIVRVSRGEHQQTGRMIISR